LAKLPHRSDIALAFCILALLTACAAPRRTATLAAPGPTAVPTGAMVTGIVVGIRPVMGGGLSPGAADVLAALQIPAPAKAPNATEFVIQRSDGSVASVVVRAPASSPTASMSASDFRLGDQVELLTGDQTELIHPP
jgi:hypothetical protein